MTSKIAPISGPPQAEEVRKKPSLEDKQAEVIQRLASLSLSLQTSGVPITQPISKEALKAVPATLETYTEAIRNITKLLKQPHIALHPQAKRLLNQFKKIKTQVPHDESAILNTLRLISDTEALIKRVLENSETGTRLKKRQRTRKAGEGEPEQKRQEPLPERAKRATPSGGKREVLASKRQKKAKKVSQTLAFGTILGLEARTSAQPLSMRRVEQVHVARQRAIAKTPMEVVAQTIEQVSTTPLRGPANPFERVLSVPFDPVSEKLLYHILGDAIGSDYKNLVGMGQKAGWQALLTLLDIVSVAGDTAFHDAVVQQARLIDQGLDFYSRLLKAAQTDLPEVSKRFEEILKALHPGERFIMPGGWEDDPDGHAMVYEFRSSETQPGRFTLLIHNVGAGVQYHAEEIVEGRVKASCYRIDSIEISQRTIHPLILCIKNFSTLSTTVWTADHVYRAFDALLGSSETSLTDQTFTDLQRSGTCTFASYFAFLHSQMDPIQCGRLRLALGLKVLASFVATIDPNSEHSIALAKRCSLSYSRMLLQGLTESCISVEDVHTIQKHLTEINDRLNCIEERRAINACCLQSPSSPISQETQMALPTGTTRFSPLEVQYIPPASTAVCFPLPAFFPPRRINSGSEILPFLDEFASWAKGQLKAGNEREMHHEIAAISQKIAAACKMYSDALKSFPQKDKAACINRLTILGNIYVRTIMAPQAREEGKISPFPAMLFPLFNLISAASIIGADIDLICRYPVVFNKILDDADRPFAFESERESDFFYSQRTIKSLIDIGFGGTINCYRTSRHSENEEIREFFDILKRKYGPQAVDAFHRSESISVAMLLATEHASKSRSILPSEFFDFKDLVDCIGFLSEPRWPISEEGPLIHWEIEEKASEVVFRKHIKPSEWVHCVEGHLLSYTWNIPRHPYDTLLPKTKRPQSARENQQKKEFLLIQEPRANELWIDSTLAYFAEHRDLLFDSSGWARPFLEQVLFSRDALRQTRAVPGMEHTPAVIADFLNKMCTISIARATPDVALYFLRVYRKLYEHVPEVAGLKQNIEALFPLVWKLVEQEQSKGDTTLPFLWHYEHARYLDCASTHSSEELDQLIISVMSARRLMSSTPSALTYSMATFIHEILGREDVQQRLLENRDHLLNQTLSPLLPDTASRTWREEKRGVYVSDSPTEVHYLPLTGDLIKAFKDGSSGRLIDTPPALTQSLQVQQATDGRLPKKVLEIASRAYTFVANGISFRIELSADKTRIYKSMHNRWYQLVTEEELQRTLIYSREQIPAHINRQHNCWLSPLETQPGGIEKLLFSFESSDGIPLFEIVQEGESVEVFALGREGRASVIPSGELPRPLLALENSQHIIPTSTVPGVVSMVSFPRLGSKGLRIAYDEAQKWYRNADSPHEILLRDQYLSSVPRLLHKLVFKDTITLKKQVVIPGHNLFGEELAARSRGPRREQYSPFEVTSSLEEETPLKGQIPTYWYRKEGRRLIPETTEGAVYLAYTYLSQQQYEDGARILREIEHLPLSEESRKILSWMAVGIPHDHDPESIALRLKAQAALLRQKQLFHKEIDLRGTEKLVEEYRACMHLCGNVFVTSEEALLLGVDPETLKMTVETRREPVPRYSLDEYYIKIQLPYEATMTTGVVSPIAPAFTEPTYFELRGIFLRGSKAIEEQWAKVQYVINNAFGIPLEPYSPESLRRLDVVLDIAARIPPSPQQTAAAILLTLLRYSPEQRAQALSLEDAAPSTKEDFNKMCFRIAQKLLVTPSPPPEARVEKVAFSMPPELPSLTVQPTPLLFPDPAAQSLEPQFTAVFIPVSVPLPPAEAVGFARRITALVRDTSPIAQRGCREVVESTTQFTARTTTEQNLSIDQTKLKASIEWIRTTSRQVKQTTKDQKHVIEALLGKKTIVPERAHLIEAITRAGYARTVRVQDALFALLDPFPKGFLELNPALSVENAQLLRETTIKYLLYKTYQYHLQEILQASTKIDADLTCGKAIPQEERQALYLLSLTKRGYDPHEHPEYLVFESGFAHFLRKQQIENLGLFLSGDAAAQGKVLEMIMAGGKTSVLIPLITKVVVSRGKLSATVFPENLYPSMAPLTAQGLRMNLDTQVFAWDIKATEIVSLETLRVISQGLKISKSEGQVALLKPKDMTGLFLQFLSTIQNLPDPIAVEKVELFQEIFSLFAYGEFLFDEVDAIWDVLKEHFLAIANLKLLDRSVIEASALLFTILVAEKERVSDPQSFSEKLTPRLMEKFVETLQTFSDPTVASAARANRDLIMGYLRKEVPKTAIETLPPLLKNMLAVAFTQIHQILPETYTRVFGVHYGESAEGSSAELPCAVPYERGIPVPSSRFGHELVEVNQTIQMFLYLPDEKFRLYFLPLLRTLRVQFEEEVESNPGKPFEETSTGVLLQSIVGKPLAQEILLTPAENGVTILSNYLRGAPQQKILLVKNLVLTAISRPTSYLRASSQTYGTICGLLRGFSGTLWNRDTYPITSQVSPESIGKTLSILAAEETAVAVVSPEDDRSVFRTNEGFIDVGGLFQNVPGIEIAKKMLLQCDATIEGVIFFDANRLPMVLSRDGSVCRYETSPIPREKRIAYWGLPDSFGIDVQIAQQTTCAVFVSKDSILRDILQGVWRLRGLGKGQHVHFIVDAECHALICQRLGLPPTTALTKEHLIAFTLQKQIDRQGEDNYRSLQQKADAILQKGFVRLVLREGVETLSEALDECKSLFFQQKPALPFDEYGKEPQSEKSGVAISRIINNTLRSSACRYLITKGILEEESVRRQLAQLAKEMEEKLPESVPQESSAINTSIQIQTQTQTQTQMQVPLVELESSSHTPQQRYFFNLLYELCEKEEENYPTLTRLERIVPRNQRNALHESINHLLFPLWCIFPYDARTALFAECLPQNIATSVNVHEVSWKEFTPLTRDYIPIEYGLLIRKGEERVLIATDQVVAKDFMTEKLRDHLPGYETALVNIHSGVFYSCPIGTPLTEATQSDFQVLILRTCLKIVFGDLHLSSQEQQALLAWCTQLGPEGHEKMARFITEYVCVMYPEANEYKERVLLLLHEHTKQTLSRSAV